MVDAKDVRALRLARTEFHKHGINIMRADIRVLHGILYIRGFVEPERGSQINDLKHDMEVLARVLRQKAEIREVILDCNYAQS